MVLWEKEPIILHTWFWNLWLENNGERSAGSVVLFSVFGS